MKAFSFIRWRFVVPVGIFIAAIVVFFVVFFDPLLAKGIEIGASKANGAKVDVEGLKTKIFQGRLEIARIQMTNKESPMENLVDVGPLAFQLEFSELVSKRVIIPEASVKGLQFNTKRKKSGAMPAVKRKQEAEEPSAAAKLASKYANQFSLNMSNVKFDAKQKITFDPKDTSVYKQGEALKDKVNTLPDQWKAKIDGLNVDGRLKDIEAKLQEVKGTQLSGSDAIKNAQAGLKKLKEAKSDLDKLKNDVKAVRDQANAEIKATKTGVTGLQDAKQKDIDDLLSRLNLDFLSPKRLVNGIVGPMVLNRFHTILGYVQTARRAMPSKQEAQTLPPKPRAKGEDIKFWSPAAPPRFWLKKAELAGAFQGIAANGLILNATSDPARVGKPTTLDLKGNQGARQFAGNVTIDHVTDAKKDTVNLHVTGIDVRDMVSSGTAAAFLTGGSGGAEIAFAAMGEDQISGLIQMNLSKLKVDRNAFFEMVGLKYNPVADHSISQVAIQQSLMSQIADSLEKLPTVSIAAKIKGTWGDPDLSIDSNLDNEFARIIKNAVGNVVAEQRKQIEDKLQSVIKEQTAAINEKLAGAQNQLNNALGGHEAKVQQKIQEATGINLSPKEGGAPIKIPSLDKLFKKK